MLQSLLKLQQLQSHQQLRQQNQQQTATAPAPAATAPTAAATAPAATAAAPAATATTPATEAPTTAPTTAPTERSLPKSKAKFTEAKKVVIAAGKSKTIHEYTAKDTKGKTIKARESDRKQTRSTLQLRLHQARRLRLQYLRKLRNIRDTMVQ